MEFSIISSSHDSNGSVRQIDRNTVHKICSGQVIVTLAVAVKELVENSLDAGSTSIEIRLKNYGSESIEIIDNGSGVKESNFKSLTLKHHTSKLYDFSDIISLDTFGFRGEALSSLCALSNVTIITCHKDATIGTKLEYDHSGNLMRQTPCPTQIGTTVILQNIFETLPVRHKEFIKNLKREFNRMIQVLYGHCIISRNVRFSVTNQIGDGKRNYVLSTHGHESIKENISSIFGPKQLRDLMEFKQHFPNDELLEEFKLSKNNINEEFFRINGYVSSCAHNLGRSSCDRQFFFINGRPCDSTKLARITNEVYHSFNRHQYPFVVLDIQLNKEAVDVNVTPDKRQIFVQNEKLLLAIIKGSLLKMYENIPNTIDMQPSPYSKPVLLESQLREKIFDTFCIESSKDRKESSKGIEKKLNLKRDFAYDDGNLKESPQKKNKRKQIRLENFFSAQEAKDTDNEKLQKELEDNLNDQISYNSDADSEQPIKDNDLNDEYVSSSHCNGVESEDIKDSFHESDNNLSKESGSKEESFSHSENMENSLSDCTNECGEENILKINLPESESYNYKNKTLLNKEQTSCGEHKPGSNIIVDELEEVRRKEIIIQFDVNSLKKIGGQINEPVLHRRFKAKINPQENKTAEEELKKQLQQEMFPKMKIIGQFNLGFIITKLGSDLFIIDQHASDEKFNFETLQKTTVIDNQRLVQPIPLELTAVNENILIENIDIFRKNGFDFDIDEKAEPTKKVNLISVPVSKNWMFGKDDVEELIFMLSDSPGVLCRPSRITKMFASRACRKSVMIGSALKYSEMRKLVNHMGEIEQPWNCPHGRPTLRHLIDLRLIKTSE